MIQIVDLPRIELGTVQCECTGIPLTYRPAHSSNYTIFSLLKKVCQWLSLRHHEVAKQSRRSLEKFHNVQTLTKPPRDCFVMHYRAFLAMTIVATVLIFEI